MAHSYDMDEEFFEGRGPEKNYVLGAFYSCYIPKDKRGIVFQSRKKDLVMLIHGLLGSEHSISKIPAANSWYFQAKNAGSMRRWLNRNGVSVPRMERIFPEVDEEVIDHFIRGYIDAQANYQTNGDVAKMLLGGITEFKRGLHRALVEHARVMRADPTTTLRYGHNDSVRIGKLMYRDHTIVRRGIYLPEPKYLLDVGYQTPRGSGAELKATRLRKVIKATKILATGRFDNEVKREVGYNASHGLNDAVKKHTGMNPTQIRELAILNKAKELLLEGKLLVVEVAKACHCTEYLMQKLFREKEGTTARAWAKAQR